MDARPSGRTPEARDRSGLAAPLPAWARTADFLSLLFLLLAAIVAVSGGFRTHLFGALVTFTSPMRLVGGALAVALVRHLAIRSTPIHEHLAAAFRQWWNAPGLKTALGVLIATRPAIYLVGLMAVFFFGFPVDGSPLRISANELLNLPVRWDAGWYLQIAMNGYSYVPDAAGLQQNIVFFPAFPALVRIAGLLFGNRDLSYVLGAVVVSLVAWVGALVYVYGIARDFVDDERARFTLWLIGVYPFALFYGAVYTESLFLLAAAGAVYHFTRRQWWRAAAWGFVAGFTRPNGCFLSVVLALLAVSPVLPRFVAGGDRTAVVRSGDDGRGRWFGWPALLAASAPGIAVLVYSAWVWRLTGNPIAWAAGHLAWGRQYRGLWALVADHYDFISRGGVYNYLAQAPQDFLNALGVIFVLAAAWPVYRRLGLAYAVFILINILPPLADGGLLSAGRFSAVLFPAFIWFAAFVPERHRAGWVASFAVIQALNAILFYTWRLLY